MELSEPRATTSMRPEAQATAPGSEVITPPRGVQLPQAEPLEVICHRPLSVPRADTSLRGALPDEASGPEDRTPIREVHSVFGVNFAASRFHSSIAPPA